MENKIKVYEGKILGNPVDKNIYLVNWFYFGNYGTYLIYGNSEEEVIKDFIFYKNKDVSIIVTKIDRNNFPVIRDNKNFI